MTYIISRRIKREEGEKQMNKLLAFVIALLFVFGTVGNVFAGRVKESGIENTAAPVPEVPGYEDHNFVGWDVDSSNVTGNGEVEFGYSKATNYQLTIYYVRYSEGLEDWVAVANSTSLFIECGTEYDVSNYIPASIDKYYLIEIVGGCFRHYACF